MILRIVPFCNELYVSCLWLLFGPNMTIDSHTPSVTDAGVTEFKLCLPLAFMERWLRTACRTSTDGGQCCPSASSKTWTASASSTITDSINRHGSAEVTEQSEHKSQEAVYGATTREQEFHPSQPYNRDGIVPEHKQTYRFCNEEQSLPKLFSEEIQTQSELFSEEKKTPANTSSESNPVPEGTVDKANSLSESTDQLSKLPPSESCDGPLSNTRLLSKLSPTGSSNSGLTLCKLSEGVDCPLSEASPLEKSDVSLSKVLPATLQTDVVAVRKYNTDDFEMCALLTGRFSPHGIMVQHGRLEVSLMDVKATGTGCSDLTDDRQRRADTSLHVCDTGVDNSTSTASDILYKVSPAGVKRKRGRPRKIWTDCVHKKTSHFAGTQEVEYRGERPAVERDALSKNRYSLRGKKLPASIFGVSDSEEEKQDNDRKKLCKESALTFNSYRKFAVVQNKHCENYCTDTTQTTCADTTPTSCVDMLHSDVTPNRFVDMTHTSCVDVTQTICVDMIQTSSVDNLHTDMTQNSCVDMSLHTYTKDMYHSTAMMGMRDGRISNKPLHCTVPVPSTQTKTATQTSAFHCQSTDCGSLVKLEAVTCTPSVQPDSTRIFTSGDHSTPDTNNSVHSTSHTSNPVLSIIHDYNSVLSTPDTIKIEHATINPEHVVFHVSKPGDFTSIISKPENFASLTSNPENSASLTYTPEDFTLLTNKPENSASLTNKPEDLASINNKLEDCASLICKPEDSATLASKPEDSASLSSKPKDSVTLASKRKHKLPTPVLIPQLTGRTRRKKVKAVVVESDTPTFSRRKRNNGKVAICKYCQRGFCDYTGVYMHARKFHTLEEDLDQYLLSIRPLERVKCRVCGVECEDRFRLQHHEDREHYRAGSFSCSHCGKTFNNTVALKAHVRAVHLTSGKPHTCNHCSATFKWAATLKQHVQEIHRGVKAVTCDMCGKQFYRQSQLNRHYVVHAGEESKFQCSLCGRRFGYMNNLQRHVTIVHHRPLHSLFHCSYCGKGFPRKANLICHVEKAHFSMYPYHCAICKAHFPRSLALEKHMATVHDDPDFKAPQGRRSHFKYHRTEEDMLCCSFCGDQFFYKAQLVEHIHGTHGNTFPFHCHTCGQGFLEEVFVTVHQQQAHGSVDRDSVCIVKGEEGYSGLVNVSSSFIQGCREQDNTSAHHKQTNHSNQKSTRCITEEHGGLNSTPVNIKTHQKQTGANPSLFYIIQDQKGHCNSSVSVEDLNQRQISFNHNTPCVIEKHSGLTGAKIGQCKKSADAEQKIKRINIVPSAGENQKSLVIIQGADMAMEMDFLDDKGVTTARGKSVNSYSRMCPQQEEATLIIEEDSVNSYSGLIVPSTMTTAASQHALVVVSAGSDCAAVTSEDGVMLVDTSVARENSYIIRVEDGDSSVQYVVHNTDVKP